MRYEFRDIDGGLLAIKDSDVEESVAVIEDMIDGVHIPPHQVPPICRALYEAAGLPVPRLPDIPDPELVGHLARDLGLCIGGTAPVSFDETVARRLIARGWGRTS